jgi:hypothetical protein
MLSPSTSERSGYGGSGTDWAWTTPVVHAAAALNGDHLDTCPWRSAETDRERALR